MNLCAHSRLSEPNKHKYVALIEFSLGNSQFSVEGARQATGLSNKEFRFVAETIFLLNINQAQLNYQDNALQEWVLKPEAYFSYLQYLEFKHSIEHARRAYWLSVLAIVISIIGVGISLK